jgi:predicted dehydrogenase
LFYGDGVKPLRIGVLGAARISPNAIVTPSQTGLGRLVAVAARDEARSRKFAEDHGVEKILDSYQEVLDDPDVEVVYNPLPNGLHAVWNLRALEAGKHVLSEKPAVANAEQAREILEAATSSKAKFMEAFHYRYHPVMEKMLDLVASGELGVILHVDIEAGFPLDAQDDVRLDFELAGGALMDVGCYAVHALRHIGTSLGGEPTVTSATATESETHPGIDEHMEATLQFPSGATARFVTSFGFTTPRFTLRIEGDQSLAYAYNFLAGQDDDRVIVIRGGIPAVSYLGTTPSYEYQLQALRNHIKKGSPIHSGPEDSLAQAELIDALYEAAGLPIRPSVDVD